MTTDVLPRVSRPIVVGVVLIFYVAVILGYPLFGDDDLNGGVFLVGWLGSSFLVGFCVHLRWILAVPILVGSVLLGVSLAGLSDSEFLTDSLSSIGVIVLTGGEIIAMRIGIAAASLIEARRSL
jgi:hypothetical protein